jgi:drug/metabolite transporter (DMT)-like permease
MFLKSSSLTRGYIIALISAAFLSTTAIFIRYLTQTYQIQALVLAFWRDAFVVITLVPLFLILRPALLHIPRQSVIFILFYGLVLALLNAMWTLSVALNGAAIATVLAYSSAAFTALLGWWILKERLDWAKLVAVGLSFGGCFLVSGAADPAAGTANLAGIGCGILSGVCYAGYSLMGRSAGQRGLNPWTTLLYTFGVAAIFLLIINLIPGGLFPGAAIHPADLVSLGHSFSGWGILFLLAAGPTVAGFGLYNVSLTYLPSSVANLILTTEPAFTAVTAYFLLNEHLDGIQIAGSVLIVAGVVFLRIFEGWLSTQA